MMNAAIAMEGLQRDSQAEWKRKQVTVESSSHPHTQKVQVVRRGPINHQAGLRFGSPSKLLILLPHSTMLPRSRCSPSSLRDNRSHLARDLGTSLALASNVAKMATMPERVPRTSQLSLLNRQ